MRWIEFDLLQSGFNGLPGCCNKVRNSDLFGLDSMMLRGPRMPLIYELNVISVMHGPNELMHLCIMWIVGFSDNLAYEHDALRS